MDNQQKSNQPTNQSNVKRRREVSPKTPSAVIETRKEKNVASPKLPPKFLIVSCSEEGKDLSKVSPFLIHKAITGCAAGPVASIKKLRNGTLLLETSNSKQSQLLLKMTSFFDQVKVLVAPHKTLNSSRGVISCRDLLYVREDEIQSELESEGVTEVVRIMRMENGQRVPTASLILTFGKPSIPEYLYAGYQRLPVRPYVPNPRRCFKCQRFGHVSSSCSKPEVCGQCGSEGHVEKVCTSTPKCPNCAGDHPARSFNCPKFKEEKAILSIMAKDKTSFNEAKKKFKSTQPRLETKSYASATTTEKSCSNCVELNKKIELLTEQINQLLALVTKNMVSNVKTNVECAEKSPLPVTSTKIKRNKTLLETSDRNVKTTPNMNNKNNNKVAPVKVGAKPQATQKRTISNSSSESKNSSDSTTTIVVMESDDSLPGTSNIPGQRICNDNSESQVNPFH